MPPDFDQRLRESYFCECKQGCRRKFRMKPRKFNELHSNNNDGKIVTHGHHEGGKILDAGDGWLFVEGDAG